MFPYSKPYFWNWVDTLELGTGTLRGTVVGPKSYDRYGLLGPITLIFGYLGGPCFGHLLDSLWGLLCDPLFGMWSTTGV